MSLSSCHIIYVNFIRSFWSTSVCHERSGVAVVSLRRSSVACCSVAALCCSLACCAPLLLRCYCITRVTASLRCFSTVLRRCVSLMLLHFWCAAVLPCCLPRCCCRAMVLMCRGDGELLCAVCFASLHCCCVSLLLHRSTLLHSVQLLLCCCHASKSLFASFWWWRHSDLSICLIDLIQFPSVRFWVNMKNSSVLTGSK